MNLVIELSFLAVMLLHKLFCLVWDDRDMYIDEDGDVVPEDEDFGDYTDLQPGGEE